MDIIGLLLNVFMGVCVVAGLLMLASVRGWMSSSTVAGLMSFIIIIACIIIFILLIVSAVSIWMWVGVIIFVIYCLALFSK